MRQIKNRILHAQLQIDELRLNLIRQYPVPVPFDFGDIPEERKNFLVGVINAVDRMGGGKAVVNCGLYTEEQIEDAVDTVRTIINRRPVPAGSAPLPPHPLDDRAVTPSIWQRRNRLTTLKLSGMSDVHTVGGQNRTNSEKIGHGDGADRP